MQYKPILRCMDLYNIMNKKNVFFAETCPNSFCLYVQIWSHFILKFKTKPVH